MAIRDEGDVDRESTSQTSIDGAGVVKAAGTVCRPDAEGTPKLHLGGEKSIIVHKYYSKYQSAIHNHTTGVWEQRGRREPSKEKPETECQWVYNYGPSPHAYKGG